MVEFIAETVVAIIIPDIARKAHSVARSVNTTSLSCYLRLILICDLSVLHFVFYILLCLKRGYGPLRALTGLLMLFETYIYMCSVLNTLVLLK